LGCKVTNKIRQTKENKTYFDFLTYYKVKLCSTLLPQPTVAVDATNRGTWCDQPWGLVQPSVGVDFVVIQSRVFLKDFLLIINTISLLAQPVALLF